MLVNLGLLMEHEPAGDFAGIMYLFFLQGRNVGHIVG